MWPLSEKSYQNVTSWYDVSHVFCAHVHIVNLVCPSCHQSVLASYSLLTKRFQFSSFRNFADFFKLPHTHHLSLFCAWPVNCGFFRFVIIRNWRRKERLIYLYVRFLDSFLLASFLYLFLVIYEGQNKTQVREMRTRAVILFWLV